MPDQKKDTIIIGAGLTGLTLAHYLKKAGEKIMIIEKENRVGGVIRTHEENGFIFESGPNTGVVGHPEVTELFEDLKNHCSLEIANPKAKNRLIWKNGKWNALPSAPFSAVGTPLFTLKDKFRILGEPFRKKGENQMESVAEMVKRRLGKSFLDYAVDPFISGIYAGDPYRLITKYALPKLYALEQNYGSFIKGSIQKKKEPKTDRDKKATREVFSAKGGLNQLIDALEQSVGKEHFILNAEKTSVSRNDGQYTVNISTGHAKRYSFVSGKIVSTIGGYALPQIFSFLSKEKLKPITDLEYARIVQVILAYEKWDGIPLNAFGGLVPSKENRPLLGILFTSSCFENRCPEGGAILSIFMGGIKRPELVNLSDAEIENTAKSVAKNMLKTNNDAPTVLRIFRYEKAIPQYEASSPDRLKCIREIENEFPGLILAGNIRDGISMADRIKQAADISVSFMNDHT